MIMWWIDNSYVGNETDGKVRKSNISHYWAGQAMCVEECGEFYLSEEVKNLLKMSGVIYYSTLIDSNPMNGVYSPTI